jgi:hypothetical protein
MKISIIVVFIFILSGFMCQAQKFSWGIIGGVSRSFEFAKQPKNNISYVYNKQTLVSNGLNSCYGFYTTYKLAEKHNIELQIRKLTIVRSGKQDVFGNPILVGAKTIIHNFNSELCYGYGINKNFFAFVGIYDNLLALHGFNDIFFYGKGISLKYYDNTYGVTLKLNYLFRRRMNIESGFMYPFSQTAESFSTAYYNPMFYTQLKYRIVSNKKKLVL